MGGLSGEVGGVLDQYSQPAAAGHVAQAAGLPQAAPAAAPAIEAAEPAESGFDLSGFLGGVNKSSSPAKALSLGSSVAAPAAGHADLSGLQSQISALQQTLESLASRIGALEAAKGGAKAVQQADASYAVGVDASGPFGGAASGSFLPEAPANQYDA